MQTILVLLTVLTAPGGFRAYDRVPLNSAMTRFANEERSHRGFSQLLDELSGRPLEHDETAWMVDVPFSLRLWSAGRTCQPDTGKRWDHYEVPQEKLERRDRGVWRCYLIAARRGSPAIPDTGFALGFRDTCIVLQSEE
ncbi:MAG: hypothetical protein HY340_04155 [Candidatus Kerfeldbacteria bacterium]|nr:hypothetical protein [Candidatus Kerfeldbacteria bacterium]